MNLREERIQELTDLIAARMPPRKIEVAVAELKDDALPALPVIEQSARARAIRRIAEIAAQRGWQVEVTRALDRHRTSYIDDLSDAAVFKLRDRMEYLEECVQCACDPDDSPPAR